MRNMNNPDVCLLNNQQHTKEARMAEKDLARFSKEQTAKMLAGGDIGRPQWADPEMQRRQDEQRDLLREALSQSVEFFVAATKDLSPRSSEVLEQYAKGAMEGDEALTQKFLLFYGDLCLQALRT